MFLYCRKCYIYFEDKIQKKKDKKLFRFKDKIQKNKSYICFKDKIQSGQMLINYGGSFISTFKY